MAFKRKNPAQLAEQLQELNGGSYSNDKSDQWNCARDAAGNGKAIIRFLPGKTEDDLPFVKLVTHSFKKNGWYIENCPSTHGDYDACPVCQYLSENDSYNTNKQEYGEIKRKIGYWANILVIKDFQKPENNGKVFKFRFGKKIWDKINGQVDVDKDMGQQPIDVTCPWEGANFALKIKEVSGYANYDESTFMAQSAIENIDDESYQDELMSNMHDITKLVDKSEFKSKEDLEKQFKKVYKAKSSRSEVSAEKQADEFEKELEDFNSGITETKPTVNKKVEESTDDIDDLLNDL